MPYDSPFNSLQGPRGVRNSAKCDPVKDALCFKGAYCPPRLNYLGVIHASGTLSENTQLVTQSLNELLHTLLPRRCFLHNAARSTATGPRRRCRRTSAAALRAFSSLLAFSSGLITSRPLASRTTGVEPSASVSSASWRAVFMSRARDSCPINGKNRSPPKIAPKTSSGSTKPPSGALSLGPNSLYFCRSWGSESVW
jgi:hypothetical protein